MSHVTLRLKRQAKRYGITHDQIAAVAHVGRTLVSHVFAGRAKSGNVVATARRLIAARKAERQIGPGGRPQPEAGGRAAPGARRSTARALLRHATGWAGHDLDERLAEVSRLRSRARF